MSGITLKKKCTKCGKIVPLIEFHKDKTKKDGHHSWCRECSNIATNVWYYKNRKRYLAQSKKWYQKNRKKLREYEHSKKRINKQRDNYYKRNYNITLKEYNKILKEQNYKCAICGKTEKENKINLAVDHNHATNFIRGLLCIFCNSWLLKHFHDNKVRTIGLIKYLARALEQDRNWK